jgi:transcriptional regulator with XRE-family HTH domain
MKPTLGHLIQQRRKELNLTQEELAQRVGDGVRQSDISRLEHDKVVLPRRGRLERIASALDLPVGTLLVQSGWMGASPDPEASLGDESSGPMAPQSGDHDLQVRLEDVIPGAPSLPKLRKTMHEVRDLVETAESALDQAQAKIADAVDVAS